MSSIAFHTVSNEPSALDYFDKLLKASLPNETPPIGNVVETTAEFGKHSTYKLCQLITLIPSSARASMIEWAASALLAVHHFNNGIESVIPMLKRLTGTNGTCSIRFTTEFFDTKLSPVEASRVFTQIIRSNRKENSFESPFPLAIIGPARSAVAEPLAVLSGLSQIPLISPTATSTTLDNKGQYPLFGRPIPSNSGDATAVIEYLISLGVTHAGVVHIRDSYGSTYREKLQSAARGKVNLVYSSFPWMLNKDELRPGIKTALQQVAKSNYRYFVGIITGKQYEMFAEVACEVEIIGPDFVWIFAESIVPSVFVGNKYDIDSPITKAFNGNGIISIGISPEVLDDRRETIAFVKEYPRLNDDVFKSYLREKQHFIDYDFSTEPKYPGILIYDSIIALGIAACNAEDEIDNYLPGQTLFDQFKKVNFDGVSGHIKFDGITGTRSDATAVYKMTNIVASPPDENGTVTFLFHDTSAYKLVVSSSDSSSDNMTNSSDSGKNSWMPIGSRNFTYSSGSDTPPASLPEIKNENMNLIGTKVQIIGLIMASIIILLSVICASMTHCYRRNVMIRASQPFFLIVICVGTFIMGLAIIPLSFEGPVFSATALNISCMATWWLYSIGFVAIFATIFSKTWRITQIMCAAQFRRRRVTVNDVLKPLSLLLFANIVILIIWSIWSPLTYERVYVDSFDEFGRSVESYGACVYDKHSFSFAGIILSINACLLILVNYQAYKGRKVQSEVMNESMNIAYAVGSTLQGWLLGFPVLLASWKSPPAKFMTLSCIIFITCVATLSFLFIPKFQCLRNPNVPSSNRLSSITTMHPSCSRKSQRVVKFQ